MKVAPIKEKSKKMKLRKLKIVPVDEPLFTFKIIDFIEDKF